MTVPGYAWVASAALGAAFLYASGAVIQQCAAFRSNSTRPSQPEALPMLRILSRPLWLVGVALDGAGFLLEFAALRAGSVSVVQPLLVSGLLFALLLGAVLSRHRLRPAEFGSAALICAGLGTFLLAARPGPGTPPASGVTWLVAGGGTLATVGLCVLAGRGRTLPVRAALTAGAAGLVNGLFAGLAKATGTTLHLGWLAALHSWYPWALAAAAVLTLTLAARAFQLGAPAAAVTGLFAVEPVSGVAAGAILFGESIRHTPALLAIEFLGITACLIGVALLARSPAVLATYAPNTPPGTTPDERGPAPPREPLLPISERTDGRCRSGRR